MILVPLPNARDHHQLHNARIVCAAGAGRLIQNHELTAESLMHALREALTDEPHRLAMSARSRAFAIPDAAARVAR
jgi:UDP-N-acetylglucosamine:LPS N-acetylglucosamine transferase